MLLKTYLIWVGIASVLCALAFFVDKRAAAHPGRRRIPEISLLALISLGGSIGGLFGIYFLRHKRRCRTKFHFHVIVILACVVQAGLLFLIIGKNRGLL